MPLVGISIEKEVDWRGKPEQFANVYHFDSGLLDALGWSSFVDNLVADEKLIHGSLVRYKTARVWEAGGSPTENEMLLIKDLTGGGAAVQTAGFNRQAVILASWELPRKSVTGRKVYLRKYFHTCSTFGSTSVGMLDGNTPFTASVTDPVKAFMNSLRSRGVDGTKYCSPSGERPRDGVDPIIYPYLLFHQFKQH